MGMLTRGSVVLALVLSGAVAMVGGRTPAVAAEPCTETFRTGRSGPVPPGGVETFWADPASSWMGTDGAVTDVDVHLSMQAGYDYETRTFEVSLVHEATSSPLMRRRQVQGGSYRLTYDDEATDWWGSGQPEAGTFKPDEPLAHHDHSRVRGGWGIEVRNLGGGFIDMHEMWVAITSDFCDSDGDGLPTRLDNCPTVANRDQADWDGDGLGNACDSTPGTDPNAPPPTTAPTTSPTASPTTGTSTAPPATVTSGCTTGCGYARTVELRHKRRKRALVGSVASVAEGCRSVVPVSIWRKRSGADRRLVVVTTRASGTFRTRAPRKPGRYYATVGSAAEPLCGRAQSRTVRIRRR